MSQAKIDTIWAKAQNLDAEISGVSIDHSAPTVLPIAAAPAGVVWSKLSLADRQAAIRKMAIEKTRVHREDKARAVAAEKVRLQEYLRRQEILEIAASQLGVPVPKRRFKGSGCL